MIIGIVRPEKRPWIVVPELNSGNYWFLFLSRLFFNVAYWNFKGAPLSKLAWATRIIHEDMYLYHQWNDLCADAFDQLRAKRPDGFAANTAVIKVNGTAYDVTLNGVQRFCLKFENRYQFARVVEKWREDAGVVAPILVPGTLFGQRARELGCEPDFPAGAWQIPAGALWDFIGETVKNMTAGGKRIVRILTSPRNADLHKGRRYSILWYPIGFNELAASDGMYDFTFMTKFGLLPMDEVLHILPLTPSPDVADYLARHGVRWILARDVYAILPWKLRWSLIAALMSILFLPGRMRDPFGVNLEFGFFSDVLLYFLVKHFQCRTVVTSQAYGSEEGLHVPMARKDGVKTLFWQHGFIGSVPVSRERVGRFRNTILEQTATVSDCHVGWFDVDVDGLLARSFHSPQQTRVVRAVGPLMSGDASWLEKTPQEARDDFGVADPEARLWLGVFDIPTLKYEQFANKRVAVNPFPVEMQKRFFADLIDALERYPGLRVFYKPKRPWDDETFVRSPEMMQFIDPESPLIKSGKIVCLHYNIDPYIPYAVSDRCISVAYSTPPLLSIGAGRASAYYDPLDISGFADPQVFNRLRIVGRDNLFSRLQSWLDGDNSMDADIRELVSWQGNPLENFASLICGATIKVREQRQSR
ncbi:MAG: hypothetical protein HQL35_10060 [Alphaproteobacteria bacterium]|nr:hypothetical protein [Alphaproteobacteria bacterium]